MDLLLSLLIMTAAVWISQAQPHLSALKPSSKYEPSNLLSTNTTSPLLAHPILCYDSGPGRTSTSLRTCSPVLLHIRHLPSYWRSQYFQEGRYPTSPHPPPYMFYKLEADCAIQVGAGQRQVTDFFSWEQVRASAIEILVECEGRGGFGGVMPLGSGVGWTIKLIGIVHSPEGDGDESGSGGVEVT